MNITPTKANLMKCKNRLAFSQKGYHLLDQKRTVLIKEIMKLEKTSEAIEIKINEAFAKAYKALQQANITMGVYAVENYALSVPKEVSYEVRLRSVMGVEIPELVCPDKMNALPGLPLGFNENNPALDLAVSEFNKVRQLSLDLAEIDAKAYRLSREIRKTQKFANALDKIRIPELEENIKYIEECIEEKDREENFRIKKVKRYHQ